MRFLTSDPAQDGWNWYAYANGNPMSYADPTGYGASSVLNALQTGLSMLGFVPGFGAIADVVNAGISAARGDYIGAGFSLAAAVPFIGDFAAAGKAIRSVTQVSRVSHSAAPVMSAARVERAVAKGLGNQNPMFKAALQPFKNTNLTQAGRAVTKHPEYFGFSDLASLQNVHNTPSKLNALGASKLKDIMRNGEVSSGAGGRYPGGWNTITLPDGGAASWHASGEFIGLRGIQP
jgi:hypothetical protein